MSCAHIILLCKNIMQHKLNCAWNGIRKLTLVTKKWMKLTVTWSLSNTNHHKSKADDNIPCTTEHKHIIIQQ